ncbi:MAG: Uma2 family endonuclease [Cyclobacteriaceae bacterium]
MEDQKQYTSLEEYETLEMKEPLAKYEYFDGEVIDMSGGTINHGLIAGNLQFQLRSGLGKNSSCKVFGSDVKVEVEQFNAYVYPDVFVVCDSYKSSGKMEHVIANPKLIVEVLSDSTQERDKTEKFMYYRSLNSFQEYILVSQKSPIVELFYKESETKWDIRTFQGLDSVIDVKSLGIKISLEDIYEGIDF